MSSPSSNCLFSLRSDPSSRMSIASLTIFEKAAGAIIWTYAFIFTRRPRAVGGWNLSTVDPLTGRDGF